MIGKNLSTLRRARFFSSHLVVALVATFALATAARAADSKTDWPEWRGPEGDGVVRADAQMPTTWSPESSNVRWRTEIPGEGISSPIAVGDRVFVTTAYETSGWTSGLGLSRLAIVALSLLALAMILRKSGAGPGKTVLGFSLLFLVIALTLAIRPETLLESGNPGRSWRVGGGIGLLGLAAGAGWLGRHSSARLLGALVVLAGFTLFQVGMPPGPTGPAGLEKRLIHALPALGLALWYLITHFRIRGSTNGSSSTSGAGRLAVAAALAILGLLVYLGPNHLSGLQRAVVALDLQTGELLWNRPVIREAGEQKWDRSSFATPTPASDGERVFAYFGHGLVALDLDGNIDWRIQLPHYAGHTRYGAGASPVLNGNALILAQEQESFQDAAPGWLAAYDKRSGEELWRIEPDEAHDSYSTPLLVETASGTHLITASWNRLVGYDPLSGQELWSHPYPMEQLVSSIGRSGDLLAVTGGAYGEKVLLALEAREDGSGVDEVWRFTNQVATIVSPVIYNDLVFNLTTPGILSSYDSATGKQLWKKRLDGEHYASLLAGDGKVYAVSAEGRTSVVAAAPEFELLAENDLDDPAMASPAFAGCLLLRTARHLYCIDA